MALLRQYIDGVRVQSLHIQASDDDLTALKGLLEGKVEEWESKATGGSKADLPDVLNTMKFRIGKIQAEGTRDSCAFTVHHLDPAKSEDDVRSVVIGKFNASWNVEDNAEYCDPIYKK